MRNYQIKASKKLLLISIVTISIVTIFITTIYIYFSTHISCSKTDHYGLPLIANRYDLVKILRAEKLRSAAEIGVQQGVYAYHILSNWPECNEYHLIDIWKGQVNYVDSANVPDDQQQQYYLTTRKKLKKWENIIHYHRNFSTFAVHEIKDNSLDFIYIDARHDFTGVSEDMELYWNKLKNGGIFAGHDYLDAHEVSGQNWSVDHNGVSRTDGKAVKSAVIEFAAKKRRSVLVTIQETWPSWYFRK